MKWQNRESRLRARPGLCYPSGSIVALLTTVRTARFASLLPRRLNRRGVRCAPPAVGRGLAPAAGFAVSSTSLHPPLAAFGFGTSLHPSIWLNRRAAALTLACPAVSIVALLRSACIALFRPLPPPGLLPPLGAAGLRNPFRQPPPHRLNLPLAGAMFRSHWRRFGFGALDLRGHVYFCFMVPI